MGGVGTCERCAFFLLNYFNRVNINHEHSFRPTLSFYQTVGQKKLWRQRYNLSILASRFKKHTKSSTT
jgi:hypothetical protein